MKSTATVVKRGPIPSSDEVDLHAVDVDDDGRATDSDSQARLWHQLVATAGGVSFGSLLRPFYV